MVSKALNNLKLMNMSFMNLNIKLEDNLVVFNAF